MDLIEREPAGARAVRVIDIGIHVAGNVERIRQTLDRLDRHRSSGRVILLIEPASAAPDPAALGRGVEIVRTARAGAATAFNTLLGIGDAPFMAFLECGVELAPGALDRLCAALSGTVALAGPSTNLAASEQRRPDAPNHGVAWDVIAGYAERLTARRGDAVRELLPLHSLSDVCVVGRREPLVALGGADDAYDPGPCWEIDLSVRAHRAGWQAVWVEGAYAHRAPITALRIQRETETFTVNKWRFQDRFCGRRLRGTKPHHSSHCTGDACADFAPRELLAPVVERSSLVRLRRAPLPDMPLVSCILPTRGRPGFVAESIRRFLADEYPHRELVIVDDGDDPIEALVPVEPRIRYVRLPGQLTIGAKRNAACEHARGALIAHVDDDDWYPPGRLTAQVRALSTSGAEISGTSTLLFFDPIGERAWCYTYPRPGWVAGASMVYRRSYWQRHRFPALQVGEDWHFLQPAARAGAVVDLADRSSCVAAIHPRNSSPKITDGPFWRPVEPAIPRALLGERAPAFRSAAAGEPASLPLVSCIMPTRDRTELAALAIAKFDAQDYPRKELVIVEDARSPLADLARGRCDIQYHVVEQGRVSIGEKRNIACSLARGDVICIWDDDDWYTPARLRCQVLPIAYGEADMTGLRCDHLLCLPSGEVWEVTDEVHRRMFESDVAGGTLTFRKAIFEHVRFPHVNLAEDAAFIRMARARGCQLKHITGHGVFAYTRHTSNTWTFDAGRFYDPQAWRRTELPASFAPEVLAAHREACQAWLQRCQHRSPGV